MNESWYQAPCYSHTHLNGSYFWRWWWSWQDIHLGDLEILCLWWELFGNRYTGGGNTFRKMGNWGAVSFLPALGSSRSSLGWVRGMETSFHPNTLPTLWPAELFPLCFLHLIPFLSSSVTTSSLPPDHMYAFLFTWYMSTLFPTSLFPSL